MSGSKGISGALREGRIRAGFRSASALAARLEVGRNTIERYERGESLPELDFLVAFADVTGADLAELIRLRLASGPMAERRPAYQIINERIEEFSREGRGPYSLTTRGSDGAQSKRPAEIDRGLLTRCFEALDRLARWHQLDAYEKAQGLAALYDLALVTGRAPADLLADDRGEDWGGSSNSRQGAGL